MNKSSHRIAHVITNADSFGGAQRNTLLTLKGLVRDRYQAELVCGPGSRLIEEAKAIGVPVHVIPALIRQVNPIRDARAFLQLCRLFRDREYRIVHTHSAKAGLIGRMAAWWARVPVIVHTFHSIPFEMNGNLRSRLYIAVEQLVGSVTHRAACVGEAFRQEFLHWQIVPPEKLITIYSGIDFSSYVARRPVIDVKRQLGLEDACPILGCIGRLSEQKAQHYLIEAVALLKDKHPQIKLLLVGEGNLRSRLERQVQNLGLCANVSLLGERNDIADLLNVFDVYVMSSRWEGVGRALTEAMYWGLPVVATAVNGAKELILHEETGLVVPTQDPQAMAAAIDRLVSDHELAKRLGSNAQRKARELMDGQQMITAIEDVYATLT